MKAYVIDASVILRSILPVTHSTTVPGKLRKLMEQARQNKLAVVSVPFLTIEIANGLRFHWREPQDALISMRKALELPIHISTLTGEQVQDALELSYELHTTVYDTCYHLLARLFNATFITCDRRYYEKAKILGNIALWK